MKNKKNWMLSLAIAPALAGLMLVGCDSESTDDAAPVTDDTAGTANTMVDQLKDTASEKAGEMGDKAKEAGSAMADGVKEKVTSLVDDLKAKASEAMGSAEGEQKDALSQVSSMADDLKAAVSGGDLGKAKELIGSMTALKDKLPANVGEILEKIKAAVPSAGEAMDKAKGLIGG